MMSEIRKSALFSRIKMCIRDRNTIDYELELDYSDEEEEEDDDEEESSRYLQIEEVYVVQGQRIHEMCIRDSSRNEKGKDKKSSKKKAGQTEK